jgi:septum formation protein
MLKPPARKVVLASTSRYRRELLSRLQIGFDCAAPNVDETPREGEAPDIQAVRLAVTKAHAVKHVWPDALIIGSDQVATTAGTLLGKPGTHEQAVHQLTVMRGRAVSFFTGLCVLNAHTGREQSAMVPVTVHMRNYSDAQIERYLRADQPYDCAGSARIEKLGITLIERLDTDDPNALIGLPLIALCDMLQNEGIELP